MLCVIAKLDSDATHQLVELQKIAALYGISPKALHGHITLATYVRNDDQAFIASCKPLLQDTTPFSVLYEKLEILDATSIIVASPQKAGTLLSLHEMLAKQYGEFLDQWTRGSVWYPHTTLLYNPNTDLSPILRAIERKFTPFTATVETIEFSRVTNDGYEIMDQISL